MDEVKVVEVGKSYERYSPENICTEVATESPKVIDVRGSTDEEDYTYDFSEDGEKKASVGEQRYKYAAQLSRVLEENELSGNSSISVSSSSSGDSDTEMGDELESDPEVDFEDPYGQQVPQPPSEDSDDEDVFSRLEQKRAELEKLLGCHKLISAYSIVQDESLGDQELQSKMLQLLGHDQYEKHHQAIVQLVLADGAYTD
ncbi:hypothetical protein Ciccas_008410 [Cichlidogyrus casuarinus]|uniref:Uncharacterized protein n=1 Tax=Cichlidogyrus casuarinus TaxID=1844966 RepID=A0ABD2Q1H8_9PLAT